MDEVALQTHRYRLEGIAEEMGLVLQQTSFSPNIKERRDFSCAIVDREGRLVAQAAHIPVHLGAIPVTMEAFLEEVEPEPGTGYILNDPYRGGTHLPDISYVEPWYRSDRLKGFVINRAHHTDVGGARAGSMAASQHIDEEGFRTGPRAVVNRKGLVRSRVEDFLEATRNPEQRITDLQAQIAAARRGLQRLDEWCGGLDVPSHRVFDGLIDYSRRFSINLIDSVAGGTHRAEEWMDDDGVEDSPVSLNVEVTIETDRVVADFTGSDDQVRGNINCPRAVVCSATYYVIQGLLPREVPVNQGVLEPIRVKTRPGSVLDVEYPGPVAGGNVETSQRVVDLLLKALKDVFPERVPAASQGTMNNITFGWEPKNGSIHTYYETLGGGAGGGPNHPGIHARQVHMTNTLNTPIEEFERHFPLRVEELRIREGSGGDGHHPGGDGLIKTWRALKPVHVGILTERRRFAPYGLNEAEDGAAGLNQRIHQEPEELPGKTSFRLHPGEVLRVHTPGGGGWNPPPEDPTTDRRDDS